MNPLETALLDELTGGTQPKLLLRTRSRIDCGRWWRKTDVWLCITDSELILFAVARRRYHQRLPLCDCANSYYAPSTSQLVISPAESLRINHLKLSPREALDTLSLLSKNQPNQTNP
ncbi:MAG: hypothetical protein RI957_1652 [Verrucomicrobiota bacterium]|jgi:hypothetical protein